MRQHMRGATAVINDGWRAVFSPFLLIVRAHYGFYGLCGVLFTFRILLASQFTHQNEGDLTRNMQGLSMSCGVHHTNVTARRQPSWGEKPELSFRLMRLSYMQSTCIVCATSICLECNYLRWKRMRKSTRTKLPSLRKRSKPASECGPMVSSTTSHVYLLAAQHHSLYTKCAPSGYPLVVVSLSFAGLNMTAFDHDHVLHTNHSGKDSHSQRST